MNKKHCKLIFGFFISCTAFLFMCCSSTKVVDKNMPDWVRAPGNVYSENNFLIYVGNGDDRNSAELSALSGISAIFGQDVIVNTNASKRMEEAAADGIVAYSQNRSFSQDILNTVNVDNLVGVEVKDFWFDGNNTWYAIAVLDRAKACAIYDSMIKKNSETIDNLISFAKKDLYSLQSMCAFDFAQEIAIENRKSLEKLFVIDYDFADRIADDIIYPDILAKKKIEIANEIPVNISIEGDTKGTYTSALLDALSDFGFSGSADENVRYAIKGKVTYNYDVTTDGKTHKCYYDFESSFVDTFNDINIFPLNIRGMKAHRTVKEAEIRVKQDIIKNIESTFHEQFNNYLDSYSGL